MSPPTLDRRFAQLEALLEPVPLSRVEAWLAAAPPRDASSASLPVVAQAPRPHWLRALTRRRSRRR